MQLIHLHKWDYGVDIRVARRWGGSRWFLCGNFFLFHASHLDAQRLSLHRIIPGYSINSCINLHVRFLQGILKIFYLVVKQICSLCRHMNTVVWWLVVWDHAAITNMCSTKIRKRTEFKKNSKNRMSTALQLRRFLFLLFLGYRRWGQRQRLFNSSRSAAIHMCH